MPFSWAVVVVVFFLFLRSTLFKWLRLATIWLVHCYSFAFFFRIVSICFHIDFEWETLHQNLFAAGVFFRHFFPFRLLNCEHSVQIVWNFFHSHQRMIVRCTLFCQEPHNKKLQIRRILNWRSSNSRYSRFVLFLLLLLFFSLPYDYIDIYSCI